MREYIVNLTNNLIRKNRYDELFTKMNNPGEFLVHVTFELESQDVHAMNPEKLGTIMCSLETGDVMAGKQELLGSLNFSGDCEETLRQFVALCLAYVIRERLDPHPASPTVVPYRTAEGKSLGRLIRNLENDPDIRKAILAKRTRGTAKEAGLRSMRKRVAALNKLLALDHAPLPIVANEIALLIKAAFLCCHEYLGTALMESMHQLMCGHWGYCMDCEMSIPEDQAKNPECLTGYCMDCSKKIQTQVEEIDQQIEQIEEEDGKHPQS